MGTRTERELGTDILLYCLDAYILHALHCQPFVATFLLATYTHVVLFLSEIDVDYNSNKNIIYVVDEIIWIGSGVGIAGFVGVMVVIAVVVITKLRRRSSEETTESQTANANQLESDPNIYDTIAAVDPEGDPYGYVSNTSNDVDRVRAKAATKSCSYINASADVTEDIIAPDSLCYLTPSDVLAFGVSRQRAPCAGVHEPLGSKVADDVNDVCAKVPSYLRAPTEASKSTTNTANRYSSAFTAEPGAKPEDPETTDMAAIYCNVPDAKPEDTGTTDMAAIYCDVLDAIPDDTETTDMATIYCNVPDAKPEDTETTNVAATYCNVPDFESEDSGTYEYVVVPDMQ